MPPVENAPLPGAANLEFARALVAELQAAGVATAVVCPGSRSTPLALAVAWTPGLAHTVHVDERSAAFHALGAAKASGRPVLLVCTSGTAGANFLPAVAEAAHARVPLVVVTADRPPELRAWGAAQTLEQRGLYAGFTRWSEEAPCPSADGPGEAYARALARRAVAAATGVAPGPVHLNLPFREPLVPADLRIPDAEGLHAPARPMAEGGVATNAATAIADGFGGSGAALARELRAAERGVLLFGPDGTQPGEAAAAVRLAARLGWPLIADPASGLRAGRGLEDALVSGADLLLRDAATAAALGPDLVLRFGSLPTSKAVATWLAGAPAARLWLVDPAAAHRDPTHRAERVLASDAAGLAALLGHDAVPAPATQRWRARWQLADRAARGAVETALAGDPRLLAPQLAQRLWSALPADAVLYLANSMPIRDVDAFAGPRAAPLRVLANRGVNGIDGQVSAALGAAAALGRPTVLWCGDLALLHDVGGLLAGRLHGADLTVVVGNDDGGGIFEYLPVARSLPRAVYEPLFAVPHGLDLAALARGLGWDGVRVDTATGFEAALTRALGGGRHLIEVPMDRAANTALHQRLAEAVRVALARAPA
jgi:2-succinyl-5-enolpyruvyl-6-hydroxy-3-cyclohexene-1-carboxylate synthase